MAPRDKGVEEVQKAREWPELIVSGCTDLTISSIVKGTYRVSTMNHGKPVYKKQEKAKGLDVLVYFWDDRDGLELCGWWFGPAVGGDQVWAFHPSRTSLTPPAQDWNIPNDGPIDPTFLISARAPSVSSTVKGKVEDKSALQEEEVRRQLEVMRKEQLEFEARMKEIQRRAEERKRREEELRKRMLDAEGDEGEAPTKRIRGAEGSTRLDEERRKLEEEARQRLADEARRRDEERRRADEEVARKRDERLRQEEDEKKRSAERRKREEEEERKRREVDQARRREEDDRRRREEAKRQEERQRRLNEEAKRRKEELSILGMVDVMTRMVGAVPEDYAALRVLFDRAAENLLPYTGKQRPVLKKEAERVLLAAEGYVRQAEAIRDDWEDWYELRRTLPTSLQD